jgi:hypothetical protein
MKCVRQAVSVGEEEKKGWICSIGTDSITEGAVSKKAAILSFRMW